MNTFLNSILKNNNYINNKDIDNITNEAISSIYQQVKKIKPNITDEEITRALLDYLIKNLDLQNNIIKDLEIISTRELGNTEEDSEALNIFKEMTTILSEEIPNNELLNKTYIEIINKGIAEYIENELQKREDEGIIISKEIVNQAIELIEKAKHADTFYYIAKLKKADTNKIAKTIIKIDDFVAIESFFKEYVLSPTPFKRLKEQSIKIIINKAIKSKNSYIIYEILNFFLLEFDYSNPINKRIKKATDYMETLFEALLNTNDAYFMYYIYNYHSWYLDTNKRIKLMYAFASSKDMKNIIRLYEKCDNNHDFSYFIDGAINTNDKDFITEILNLPNLKAEYVTKLENAINNINVKIFKEKEEDNSTDYIKEIITNTFNSIQRSLIDKKIDISNKDLKQTIVLNLLSKLNSINPELLNGVKSIDEYANTISLLENTLLFLKELPQVNNQNNTNNFNEILILGTTKYMNTLLEKLRDRKWHNEHMPTFFNHIKLVDNIKDRISFLNKVSDMAIKFKNRNLIIFLGSLCHIGGEEFTKKLVDTAIESNDANCIFSFFKEHGVNRTQKARLAYAMAKTNNAKRIYDFIHYIYWQRNYNCYEKIIEKRFELFNNQQYKNYKELYETLAIALINTNSAKYISELIRLIISASWENYNNFEGGQELLPNLINALIQTENYELISQIYNNGNKAITPYKDKLAEALKNIEAKQKCSFEHKEAGPREIVETGPIRKKEQ